MGKLLMLYQALGAHILSTNECLIAVRCQGVRSNREACVIEWLVDGGSYIQR